MINLHASRLPADRGISPVLWAFARGDRSVWTSIYKVDKGLDTGPIFEQYEMDVMQIDTAFSLYARICAEGGVRLANLLCDFFAGNAKIPTPQHGRTNAILSWPDAKFDEMLQSSGRNLISVKDIINALCN